MRKLVCVLGLLALWPVLSSSAQLEPPNDAGVTMGHVHLHVRDVEANKKFWEMLGGTLLKIDDTDVIKFPGVFVFLTPGNPPDVAGPPTNLQVICGCPNDGFESSVINHVGFLVQNFEDYMTRFKAAHLILKDIPGSGRKQILAFSPDNLALEIAEDKSIKYPITEQHFHFFAPAYLPAYPHRVVPYTMFSFYVDTFGAKPIALPNLGAELPGVNMRFSPSLLPTVPSKGNVVDHIGFEVRNLEQFCKQLEAKGVKFDEPYSKTRHKGFASAMFTDPFGVSIELTEGLNRF